MNIETTTTEAQTSTYVWMEDGCKLSETRCRGSVVAFSLEAVPTVSEVLADDLYLMIEGWPSLGEAAVGTAIEELEQTANGVYPTNDAALHWSRLPRRVLVFSEVFDLDTPEDRFESIKGMREIASTLRALSSGCDMTSKVRDMAKLMA